MAWLVQGSSKGDLFVYDAETGKRLSHVEPMKVTGLPRPPRGIWRQAGRAKELQAPGG